MLSGHVTSNLDQWVEDGFIDANQREAFAQLMENALQDAYDSGLAQSDNDGGYDDGYDRGYDDGYDRARNDLRDELRDDWFEQGWAAAIAEHGIEE